MTGYQLKEWRKRKGLTQERLAQLLGYANSYRQRVAALEARGKGKIPLWRSKYIEEVLEKTVQDKKWMQ